MKKEEIIAMLDNLPKAVSVIETDLGMPSGTLAKAKKGVRDLPDKWIEPLSDYYLKNCTKKPEPKDIKKMLDDEDEKRGIPKTKLVVGKDGLKEKPVKEVVTEAMKKINKDFGEGTIMFFGDRPNQGYEVISTGSLGLDNALGIGGLPRGRMVEIFGWESSGKTTIALNVIANAQKKGLKCLLVDAENAFDPEYAEALGVEVEKLRYCQPSYGEQGLEVADKQMSLGEADVVVIDSVAALIPKAELEGAHGDSKMGLHARLMSQACRKMVGTIAKKNCICIFINQFRHKIGVMMGNPEVTTGGNALQFYASIRLEVRRSLSAENAVMDGNVKQGNQTTVKVIKNKCAPPFRKAVFNILYGVGVDRIGEVAELGVQFGVIDKAGSWFSYNGTKLGQGITSVTDILKANETVLEEVEGKLREKLKEA